MPKIKVFKETQDTEHVEIKPGDIITFTDHNVTMTLNPVYNSIQVVAGNADGLLFVGETLGATVERLRNVYDGHISVTKGRVDLDWTREQTYVVKQTKKPVERMVEISSGDQIKLDNGLEFVLIWGTDNTGADFAYSIRTDNGSVLQYANKATMCNDYSLRNKRVVNVFFGGKKS